MRYVSIFYTIRANAGCSTFVLTSYCKISVNFFQDDTRGAARKLQTTNYLAKIRVGKITTLKMVKQLSISDLQVALYAVMAIL